MLRGFFSRRRPADPPPPPPGLPRADFLARIGGHRPALEIGAFDRCLLEPPGVRHFDVLDTEALRDRARALGRDPDGVPRIDYVSPTGDLGVIDARFALVLSCHAIEHTPDLIRHLNDVAAILEPSGIYALIVPDCRYCFDHFLAPSTVAEVLQAHAERRRVHSLQSVIEHRALTTHNDCVRHWQGDHGGDDPTLPARVVDAVREWEAADGGYIDVHAWQFTPDSFRALISLLHDTGHSPLRPLEVYPTHPNELEFFAVLGAGSAP